MCSRLPIVTREAQACAADDRYWVGVSDVGVSDVLARFAAPLVIV